jgi:hypothetical protein
MTRRETGCYVDRGADRKRVRGPDFRPECPVAPRMAGQIDVTGSRATEFRA